MIRRVMLPAKGVANVHEYVGIYLKWVHLVLNWTTGSIIATMLSQNTEDAKLSKLLIKKEVMFDHVN